MLKRLISLITVFCLALGIGALAGCGNNTDADNQNNQSGGAAMGDISAEKVVYINESGESVYRIVRPNDKEMTSVAAVVFKQMKDGLGVGIRNVLDSEDGTDLNEILIGNTNRPESAQAIDYLRSQGYGRYNDYIVCTIGKKIVINGMSNEAIEKAADCFVKNFIKKEGIEGGICRLYATEGSFSDITVNGTSISKYNFVWDSTNLSWLIRQEVGLIQDFLRETTGFYVPLKEDAGTDKGEYEISIGNTDRAVKAQSEYSYEEWEILISGKKVNILGGSTYAVQVAVTEFGKMLQKKAITDADSTTGTYSETVADYDSSTYYSLKWCDEFDGDSLDTSKWSHPTDSREDGNMVNDDTTVYFKDGAIVMLGNRREDGTYYHCSGVQTANKMTFNFGYLEMRAKIPDGTGVYSSFWTTGGGLEIDIFESLGMAHTQRANIHYWQSEANGGHTSLDGGLYGPDNNKISGNDRQFVLKEGSLSDRYRTIGLYWTPQEITFIYDGEVYYTQPSDEFHIDKYQYILAGFNVGWPGRTAPAEDLQLPLEYHIDYIRLFQIDGQGLKINR